METFKFALALEARLGILLDAKVSERSVSIKCTERFQGTNCFDNPSVSKAAFLHAFSRDQVTNAITQTVRQSISRLLRSSQI